MDNLPPAVAQWLEGPIDAHAQNKVETYSQTYLIALTAISFVLSYLLGSVLVPLELFLAGLVILLAVAVPPWPYLNRHPVKFRSARG